MQVVLQAPVAIAVLDVSRQLAQVNTAWRELFDYRGPTEVTVADLQLAPAVIDQIEHVFECGRPTQVLHAPLRGAERCYTAELQPLRGAGDRITGLIMSCRDTTDERLELLRREHAERISALKDQLLAAVSHELRAPVATLLLWERILRDAPTELERTRALDAIHQSALTQSRLVADLIDVSRAVSGKLHLDIRPLAIEHVIRAAVVRAGAAAQACQLALVTDIASPLGSVRGDHDRLAQIVEQLLANAIRHTPAGGRVKLAARRDSTAIVIEVADTGPGIARDHLARVFEPLSRVRASSHDDGALGVGLTLVRELVALHDGSVMAESDGTGAKLTIRLPVAAAPAPAPVTAPTKPVARGSLRGIRILIVDDDPHVLDALRLLLTRAGATTTSESSAAAAAAALDRVVPHVLLCDVSMPLEDGYSLVRRLRAAGHRLPMIALTAHAADGDRARALDAGFDLHVAKPIHLDKLVASIVHVCTPRSSTENA